MSIATITEKITEAKHSLITNQTSLKELRKTRAQLALSKGSVVELAKLDKQIDSLVRNINNAPAEITLLEERLVTEQAKATEEQRKDLLSQQEGIARNIEQLSDDFVEALKVAVELNTELRSALTAEAGLAAKTGQQFLTEYCDGSQDSLRMLLEKSEAELAGRHTAMVGAGIVPSGQPIRL